MRKLIRRAVSGALAVCMAAAMTLPAAAAPARDDGPVAHYDMSHTGAVLTDVSGNGHDAALTGTTNGSFSGGSWHMQADSYATLPGGLLTGESFTVQAVAATTTNAAHWLFTIGDGFGSWNEKNVGNYIFVNPSASEKGGNFLAAIKAGTGSAWKEQRMPAASTGLSKVQGYAAVTLVGENGQLRLYMDGELISTLQHGVPLSEILPDTGITGYIGRSLYTADPLLTANLADLKIWDRALSEEEVRQQAPTAQQLADLFMADLTAAALGDNRSADAVTGDLSLPASLYGVSLAWGASSNPEVLGDDGTVTRPMETDASASLPVQFTLNGAQYSRTLAVTVKGVDVQAELEAAAEQLAIPGADDVRGNITLPETVGIVSVEWQTDRPDIVNVDPIPAAVEGYDDAPAGVVTRPEADTAVTLTATLSLAGQSVQKEIRLRVKAAPEALSDEDFTDYFFAYFAGEGYADGEQLYFAASQDGMNWTDLNDNKPVLTSTLGEQGVRDPFILRSAEGDRFYMIATDLKIYGNGDWSGAQSNGSQALMIWESDDLVNWSDQRMVTVSAEIGAGCTWAPEATYDPLTGEYIVYWASRTPQIDRVHRIYYAKTRDFYTFTEPKLWIEYDQSSIDTTIIEEDGVYYRYTKNEGSNTNELGAKTKTVFIETADSLLGEWTHIPSDSLNANQWVEGPAIFRLNQDDRSAGEYCLLVDNYGGGGYYPLVTDDLSTGEFARPSVSYKMPSRARHGTPMRITAEEYSLVMQQWGGQTVDTSALAAELEAADALVQADYTADSWQQLEAARTAARAVLNDADATAAQVSAAREALSAAVGALVKAPAATPTPAPTAQPTAEPTVQPTAAPTAQPTPEPTARPTATPAPEPSPDVTAQPTAAPEPVLPATGDSAPLALCAALTAAGAAGALAVRRRSRR